MNQAHVSPPAIPSLTCYLSTCLTVYYPPSVLGNRAVLRLVKFFLKNGMSGIKVTPSPYTARQKVRRLEHLEFTSARCSRAAAFAARCCRSDTRRRGAAAPAAVLRAFRCRQRPCECWSQLEFVNLTEKSFVSDPVPQCAP